MLVPLILRRSVEIPYVVHVQDNHGSHEIFGPFPLLRLAVAHAEARGRRTPGTHRQVGRLDLPVLVSASQDWANHRWAPRPGTYPPVFPELDPTKPAWVVHVDSSRLGQITYGPFGEHELADRFLTDHSLRWDHNRGMIRELLRLEPGNRPARLISRRDLTEAELESN